MPVTFTTPTITGRNAEEKLQALESWLFQFTEQIQYTLNNLDSSNFTPTSVPSTVNSKDSVASAQKISE